MNKSDFFFNLPPELIAQTPLKQRDRSRMLVLKKDSGEVEHSEFKSLPQFLEPGDLIVLNDSKVFPARIFGRKENGLCAEVLVLKHISGTSWECIAKPGRRLRKGTVLDFGAMKGEVSSSLPDGGKIISFDCKQEDFFSLLECVGKMPLPPYIDPEINGKIDLKERYNTVYAKDLGSAAAPTAGLHFTPEIFSELKKKGVEKAFVTLSVGLGTFRPVKSENILEHKMHSEHFSVTLENAEKIASAKERGSRIICIGTTSCRVLESLPAEILRNPADYSADTGIFIYPGYKFSTADCLLTNFHLPESTLIMLAAALAGRENVLNAYERAIEKKYRFFSFGDSMLII